MKVSIKQIAMIGCAAALTMTLAGCSSSASTVESTEDQAAPVALADRLTADDGTSARVDEIARIAKEDAATMSESMKNDAIEYISNNYKTCFESNEAMEQMMYYGGLLDYAYADGSTESDLGTDAVQLVKYVYRGAESVDDNATQENMLQVQEGLTNL